MGFSFEARACPFEAAIALPSRNMKRIRQGDTAMLCGDRADRFKKKCDFQCRRFGIVIAMGTRTRGLDLKAGAARLAADKAARAEAMALIDRWNEQLAAGRDMLWSPTIRAALLAGTPWLDVFCPGCGTSRAIDLRTVEPRLAQWCSACGAHGVRGADAEATGVARSAASSGNG
jgi:hypothetical protein